MLKIGVQLNIFTETVMHYFVRILWWIERSKEQHLFEIEIFCIHINVFIVSLDRFNASLLNKLIIFFGKKKNIYWLQARFNLENSVWETI